jgi:hypothetical protein
MMGTAASPAPAMAVAMPRHPQASSSATRQATRALVIPPPPYSSGYWKEVSPTRAAFSSTGQGISSVSS